MKVLFINPAWDAAGVSYKQAQAINKYTNWEARHFRAVDTFYSEGDITQSNYNKDEFITLIEEADILHFCSAIHIKRDFDSFAEMNWGFNWEDVLKNKIKIFHDYCSFPDDWKVRADKKDFWTIYPERYNYNIVWSSVPQAVWIYKDCVYIPDIVDESTDMYSPGDKVYNKIVIGHFPTGGANNKNTNELLRAIEIVKPIEVELIIKRELQHSECVKFKKQTNLGFDALWRGYHGMTTVENLALGIPTMCNMNAEFNEVFSSFFQTSEYPFENTPDSNAVSQCIINYANDIPKLEARAKEVRVFMENKWSAKNIVDIMVKKYEELLEKK